jgi:phage-related protein
MPKAPRRTPKPICFANKQAKKAFEKSFPKSIKILFSSELEDVIAYGLMPTIDSEPLPGGTIELKKNGSPAYRCVYKVLEDVIVIVHAFKKTAEGSDKKNLETLDQRVRHLDPEQFC